MPNNLLSKDGEVYLYQNFFSHLEESHLFTILKQQTLWRQESIRIMGNQVLQPRLTALYGDVDKSYSYSGITMNPEKWTDDLLFIKKKIEVFLGQKFSTVLLNYYRNGTDSMGWHRDNEQSLGRNPVIVSISLGASRPFLLRHYDDRELRIKINLTPGSLLLMKGATQHHWQHSLPKVPKLAEARINLTFRTITNY